MGCFRKIIEKKIDSKNGLFLAPKKINGAEKKNLFVYNELVRLAIANQTGSFFIWRWYSAYDRYTNQASFICPN